MSPIQRELRTIAALALPAIVTQVSAMMLGVVDTLMVGNILGKEALAAAQIGNVWINGSMLFGMGVIFGMDPLVSQGHGGGNKTRVARALHWGLVAACLVSLPLMLIWFFAEPGLLFFGQPEDSAAAGASYVQTQIASVPAVLLFTALRQFLQGQGILAPAMWVSLIANLVNFCANWILIRGELGVPALGLEGAGYATAITRWFQFLFLFLWIVTRRLHIGYWLPFDRESFAWSGLRRLFAFGIPTGFHIGLELWAFQAASLMTGHLGKTELAAHSIVMNLASLSFMIPLGISIGAGTRVGNLVGALDASGARRSAWVSLALGAGVMGLCAILFVIFRKTVGSLYINDPAVVALCASILPIAAAFQLFDGTQVVGSGILRGLGRPRPAVVINALGYWILALPLGWWLAFRQGYGLHGIWWALAFGLLVVAFLFVTWIYRNTHWQPYGQKSDRF